MKEMFKLHYSNHSKVIWKCAGYHIISSGVMWIRLLT